MAVATTRTGAFEAAHEGSLTAAGLGIGVLGGAVMALVLVLAAALSDLAPLAPLEGMGETFTDRDAPHGSAAFTVYGIFLHLAVASLFAIVFLTLVPTGFPTTSAVGTGLGYAMFVMAVMSLLVVPAVNPELQEGMHLIGGSWVIAHALYGVTLGFGPGLRRRLGAR